MKYTEKELKEIFENNSNCYADTDEVVMAMDVERFVEVLKKIGVIDNKEIFKIISRDPKTKRQVKKRVYTCREDYFNYKDNLIKRYTLHYDVEIYRLLAPNKWSIIGKVPKQCFDEPADWFNYDKNKF